MIDRALRGTLTGPAEAAWVDSDAVGRYREWPQKVSETRIMASAFERFSRPSERHATFAPLIGDWRVVMATHTAEGQVSRSEDIRAEKRWFGDRRYVREEVRGTFGGARHEKLTVLGFNNIRNRYEYMTADNYDTVVMLYTTPPGVDLVDPRRIEMFADYVDAGQGEQPSGTLVVIRTVIEIQGDDEHRLRNFYAAPGRDEFLFLQYDYRRMA